MRDYQLGETWAEIEARRTREELDALRAAVLGDMPPAEAARLYRRQGNLYVPSSLIRKRLNALADAVEGLNA